MAWDYDWRLGPKGGSLVTLDTYCKMVRLDFGAEPGGAKRGENIVNPYRPGTIPTVHKFNTELIIPLEVHYLGTTETQLSNNRTAVELNMFGTKGLATLRRTTPEDTVEAYVEPIAPPSPTQDRFTYSYLLRAPEGFWRSTTQTVDSTSPVNNGGNAPVHDAVIDIDTGATGTDVVLTMTADGATITVSGATPAGGVRVDLENGTVTQITGGADYHEFVSFNKPYHLILEPGDNAFSGAGGGSGFSFAFYDKYR
jgi:hypothetical protein